MADVRIKSPIQQNMLGQAGLFRQTNVEKNRARPLTIEEWFEKCQSDKFAGPGPKDLDRTLDRDSEQAKRLRFGAAEEKRRLREERKEAAAKRRDEKAAHDPTRDVSMETESAPNDSQGAAASGLQTPQRTNTPQLLPGSQEMKAKEEVDAVPALDASSSSSKLSSPDPIAKTPDTEENPEPIPAWYESFQPSEDWLPKDTRSEDYTPDACAQIERKFWKTMGLGEPSWYGADLQGELVSSH